MLRGRECIRPQAVHSAKVRVTCRVGPRLILRLMVWSALLCGCLGEALVWDLLLQIPLNYGKMRGIHGRGPIL